jgi:carbon storage regulator CsrA
MLVLTRRVGEEIVIASDIRVTVVMIKGRTARLGITAPSTVHIVRRELLPGYSDAVPSPKGARRIKYLKKGAISKRSAP